MIQVAVGVPPPAHAHHEGCTLFDPLERDRTMHAGIRVWQERGPGQLHVPGAGEELQR